MKTQQLALLGAVDWRKWELRGLIVLVALGIPSTTRAAQTVASSMTISNELPEAPGRGAGFSLSEGQASAPKADARLSGIITDPNGSVVQGAMVTLIDDDTAGNRVTISDGFGRFTFASLPPGTFRLTIASTGLRTFNLEGIALMAGEARELPISSMSIATATTDIQVFAAPDQIAQAQVQLAEKQRVLGVIPNFYSSYIWDAAPLPPRLKFTLAIRSTTDPVAFLLAGGVAGVEQAHNTFPGYGSGPEGYAKRYGAAYADNVIGRMIGSAILPSVFHQDPRYFYNGRGSISSRAVYAIGATIITRGDNGHLQPNYSHILGNFAAGGISNLYRTSEDRSEPLRSVTGSLLRERMPLAT